MDIPGAKRRRRLLRQKSLSQLMTFETKELTSQDRDAALASLMENKRSSLQVSVPTHMNVARMERSGVFSSSQIQHVKDMVNEIHDLLGHHGHVVFINATEQGGGVAEMRPDTTVLLRDMGISTDWLVMDGCAPFYNATVHMHEAAQDPRYKPMQMSEIEMIQMICCQNVVRMEKERILEGCDIVWVDDPQPCSMIPAIKLLHPNIIIIWRCHIHVDPEPQVGEYLSDMVSGRLNAERDYILLNFLDTFGCDIGELCNVSKYDTAGDQAADMAVFHLDKFRQGLDIAEGVIPRIMPPAINPLAFKNMPLTEDFIVATLVKYGVMQDDDESVPPLVVEVSRFDPYKVCNALYSSML